jgi:NADH dehydrogenase
VRTPRPRTDAALHVVVTGASGYLGGRVLRRLDAAGVTWTALSRRAPSSSGGGHVPFCFGEPLGALPIPRFDAVIHLAATTGAEPADAEAELAAVRSLLELSTAAGARFVFASSQTASPDAPTGYGRLKWEIEELVAASNGVNARIGLVYGGPEKGLFGTLCAFTRRSPLLPAFIPDAAVQPIHVDDVARALVALALSPAPLPPACELASPEPVRFSRFLRILARRRVRRLRVLVPVPRVLLRAGASLLAALLGAVPAPLRRIDSLFRLPPLPSAAAHLSSLGVELRSLEDGMGRSGSPRRTVAAEGRAILRHLVGAPPPGILVRRYVRALERRPSADDAARVMLATRILEASPLGAARMMASRSERMPAIVARCVASLVVDGVAALARLVRGRRSARRRSA